MLTTTNEVWRAIIKGNAGISERAFLQHEIQRFLSSKERKDMMTGRAYYEGRHEILNKKRTMIEGPSSSIELEHLPNSKIVDNKFDDLVDQKVNYILGKPIEVKTDNEEVINIFNKSMHRTLLNVAMDSYIGGKGYLYPYIDNGKIAFKRLKPEQVIPYWHDEEHTRLDAFVYLYEVELYNIMGVREVETHVEFYTPDRISYYIYRNGSLSVNLERDTQGHINMGNLWYDWGGHVPLICFKGNHIEQPLINRVKCLQDALNTMYSIFSDNMQEDTRNTILVLKNYDGTDLSEFRRNLATFGAVKVRTLDGEGGVETLQIDVNASNYEAIMRALKRSIIENGRGYDAKDERLSNNPNQMNIMSMYSDIDLDSNQLEVEYQAAFELMIEFINIAYAIVGGQQVKDVEFIFNRLTPVNESEAINNCRNSVGVLSAETIISNHPWTTSTAEEIERIKAEHKEAAAEDFITPDDEIEE